MGTQADSLDYSLSLLVFTLARQAERSLDATLFGRWSHLRSYYEGQRAERMMDAVGRLRFVLGTKDLPHHEDLRAGLESETENDERIGMDLITPFRKHRKDGRFRLVEIQFMASSLQQFLIFLCSEKRPSRKLLMQLRLDLCQCEYIVEQRCQKAPYLTRAFAVEYLGMSEGARGVQIDEVMNSLFKQHEWTHIDPI